MTTLKTAGFVIAGPNAIMAIGPTLEAAIEKFNDNIGDFPFKTEDGGIEYRAFTEDDLGRPQDGHHYALPATAALIAQVEREGGDIGWREVDGIGCTLEEAEPATRQIATGLSESGRRALAEFLATHLSDKALAHMVAAYEADITFDINDSLAGHLEVSGMHTATGNAAVRIFDGDDVILEDVEVEVEVEED